MKQRLLFFILGSISFLGFVLFSFLVHKDFFTQIDFDTTVKVQDNIPVGIDDEFSILSEIGKFEPMMILLISIVGFLLLRKKIFSILLIFFFGAFHVIEIFGKVFVDHLPPPQFMLRVQHLVDFPQFHIRLENSYPSGHAGRAAFLTVVIGILVWKSKKIPRVLKLIIIGFLIIYDMLMIISRITLGEHWLSDVLGGILLGLAMGILGVVFI